MNLTETLNSFFHINVRNSRECFAVLKTKFFQFDQTLTQLTLQSANDTI